MSRAIGSQELVRVDMTPTARVLVDNLDLGLLSNVLADIPGYPVQSLVILTGRGIDNFAIDEQQHGRCALVPG